MISPKRIVSVFGFGLLLVTLISAGCHKAGPVDATTLGPDTTSHVFTWKAEPVGTEEGSTLYDVAIINDTLAYAVGQIYAPDSTGQGTTPPYNLARWNGHSWTLSTMIPPGYLYGVGYAVFAFGPDDVWFGNTIPCHWDGHAWRAYSERDGYPGGFWINSIWGTSSKDVYFAGSWGGLVHFDGKAWQTIVTGTAVGIADMWGSSPSNPFTAGAAALMLTGYKYDLSDNRILRLHAGGSIDSMAWTPTPRRTMQGVWYDAQSKLYICGDGVFSYDGSSSWKEITDVPSIYTMAIRGTDANNIVVVGDFGAVSHYNGSTWHTYAELAYSANYRALAMKGKLVIAVGDNGSSFSRAVALIGVRQ